ncbi:hypothetical protein [Pseudoalteromonas byunsanensis]|uniref:DUF3450 domain-containing protein n=1 Tax=Pseudoalteromonas byunsanensis TaxID=327939 RepID=A0A1S1NCZ7_9GAMM|nr:hypothetical protein [Pseudoalteromonas byunsanensis]OHU96611.1 hypothetical protein BIW53_04585 [Pseudoalteromonas byunsanensis]
MYRLLLVLTITLGFKTYALPNYSELMQLQQVLKNDIEQKNSEKSIKLNDIHTLFAPSQGTHIVTYFTINDNVEYPAEVLQKLNQHPDFSDLKNQLKILSHQLFSLEKKQKMEHVRLSETQSEQMVQDLMLANQQKLELAHKYNTLKTSLARVYLRERLVSSLKTTVAELLCDPARFKVISDNTHDSVAITVNTWPDTKNGKLSSLVWVVAGNVIEQCQSTAKEVQFLLNQVTEVHL